MTAVVMVAVGVVCAVGVVALIEWARRQDIADADRDAAAVIDAADRIVRQAESRLNHPSNRTHGTASTYNYGCRCNGCTEAELQGDDA